MATCIIRILILAFFLSDIVFKYSQVTGQDSNSKVYPVDEDMYNECKDDVCKYIPALSNQNFTWSNTLTKEEIYEMAFLNLGYGLTTEGNSHLPFDLGWKKTVIDKIAYISRATCNTRAISSTFITGVKNFFQYYILKAYKSGHATHTIEPDARAWEIIINTLSICAANIKPITLIDDCGVVEQYLDKEGNSHAVDIVRELFDDEFAKGSVKGIDIIIDSIWWMFSTTYSRCYVFMYPDEDYILHFYTSFRDDILGYLHNRWRGAGNLVEHFNIIFGPFDATEQHENMRFCTYAAFAYEGLLEQHLIRPVLSFDEDASIQPNYKKDY